MNGIPMNFDYTKTLNEQLSTFDYYKDRYISYELELIRDRKEIERLNKDNDDLQNRFNSLMEAHKISDEENERLNKIINKANDYNEHLIRDAKYHLNKGHLRKMKKILNGEEDGQIC